MASLTVTAYHTRRAINWGILGLVAYILIFQLGWNIFAAIWTMLFPPPPIPPNHAFGKLPAIKFPQASGSAEFQYRLETIEGSIPTASESAMVFFMPKNSTNLLSLTKAKEFANQMEFTGEPIQETKYIYRFTDTQEPLRYMIYDIMSKNFVLRYAYQQDPSLFTQRDVPLPNTAISQAEGTLQTYQLMPPDSSAPTIRYLKFVGDTLVETTSHSQADALEVNFFRNPIADTSIFFPNPQQGPIRFIYSGSLLAKKRLLEFSYDYWPIDPLTNATYSLKTSIQAWTELQNGLGYVARYPKGDRKDVIIRKIYLGYYDSLQSQTYLQPIFVFEGDNGFIAYVPAISPEWIE